MTTTVPETYYIPQPSIWPFTLCVGIFLLLLGAASFLIGAVVGPALVGAGLLVLVFALVKWFGSVIRESEAGEYNDQVDVTYRWAMVWFILSEVFFFAAFFGALYYVRIYSVPWLGGEGAGKATGAYLWTEFLAQWPLQRLPDAFGFTEFKETVGAWGIPAWNTAALLTSGLTVTLAHWALKSGQRPQLALWLGATIVLGSIFLGLQISEYGHAYRELNLTLNSGVYGATFFMLTGFHGLHVTLGTLMLIVICLRCLRGHFTPKHHFAFEAVSWYWHFVDVVWLGLFIFVYLV
jgi:cytochrome c oxidase subunit 3